VTKSVSGWSHRHRRTGRIHGRVNTKAVQDAPKTKSQKILCKEKSKEKSPFLKTGLSFLRTHVILLLILHWLRDGLVVEGTVSCCWNKNQLPILHFPNPLSNFITQSI